MKLIFIIFSINVSFVLFAAGDHDHDHSRDNGEEQKHSSENKRHEEEHSEGHGDEGDGHEHEGEHEENIEISDVGMEVSGIQIQVAGPHKISQIATVSGEIALDKNRLAHISPRFPGLVRKVHVKLGQRVRKGQVLAVIEANGSEAIFSLKAQMSGTVIDKQLVRGQFLPSGHSAFKIADLTQVWLQLKVPEKYAMLVRKGQLVSILEGARAITSSKISYLASVMHEDSQSRVVRTILSNKSGQWRPGQFVRASITLDDIPVKLAVKRDAIQSMNNNPVIFEETKPNTFQPREVRLGIKNRDWIEVTSGISEGMRYAATSSYILKADLMKSEAEHEH